MLYVIKLLFETNIIFVLYVGDEFDFAGFPFIILCIYLYYIVYITNNFFLFSVFTIFLFLIISSAYGFCYSIFKGLTYGSRSKACLVHVNTIMKYTRQFREMIWNYTLTIHIVNFIGPDWFSSVYFFKRIWKVGQTYLRYILKVVCVKYYHHLTKFIMYCPLNTLIVLIKFSAIYYHFKGKRNLLIVLRNKSFSLILISACMHCPIPNRGEFEFNWVYLRCYIS